VAGIDKNSEAEPPTQRKSFMALPNQGEDEAGFHHSLDDLVRLTGAAVTPVAPDARGWRRGALRALRDELRGREQFPRRVTAALIDHLRDGTDPERAGAARAHCASSSPTRTLTCGAAYSRCSA
jgi:hypothetical protein